MSKWTIAEWLLLQFAVLATLGTIGFGIAFQLSKSRIRRLQKEFRKLASDMGKAIASAAEESGIQFDSLLMQTQAYLQSQGLSVDWRQVDPLQYPELMPLFLRCAVLETEMLALEGMNEDDYWVRLTATYDQLLFQFNRDSQVSNVDSKTMQRRIDDSEELVGTLRGRIATLETDLLRAKDSLMHQPLDQPLREVAEADDLEGHDFEGGDLEGHNEDSIFEYERFLQDRKDGFSKTEATEQQVNMLSNIIDDQKVRIQTMQKDLQRFQKNEKESDFPVREGDNADVQSSAGALEQQNRALSEQLNTLEMTLVNKEQEMTQLLAQLDSSESGASSPTEEALDTVDELEVRQALVEAWLHTERSLVALEHQVLGSINT